MNINIKKSILLIIAFIIALDSFSQSDFNFAESLNQAENGNYIKQSDIADYYRLTVKDYEMAVKWYKILLENDSAGKDYKGYAYHILGDLAEAGKGGFQKSDLTALNYWRKSNVLGNRTGTMHIVNYFLRTGNDPIKADSILKWYIKAADLQDADACYVVGNMYEYGKYPFTFKYKLKPENNSKVKEIIKEVIMEIGPGDKDYQKALRYYNAYLSPVYRVRGKTETFKPQTLFKVGMWYFKGMPGIPKDFDNAMSKFKDLIDYEYNPSDSTYSDFWYTRKLDNREKPLTDEQWGLLYWRLSTCYRFGRGITKNNLLAEKYAVLAADKGNKDAKAYLANNP